MDCSVEVVEEERGTFWVDYSQEWEVLDRRVYDLDADGRVVRIRAADGSWEKRVEYTDTEVVGHSTDLEGHRTSDHFLVEAGRVVGFWSVHFDVDGEAAPISWFSAERDPSGRLLEVTRYNTAGEPWPELGIEHAYTWETERELVVEDEYAAGRLEMRFDRAGDLERVVWWEHHDPCPRVGFEGFEDEERQCREAHPETPGWERIGVASRRGGAGDHRVRYRLLGESVGFVTDASYVDGTEVFRYRRGRLVRRVVRGSDAWIVRPRRRTRYRWVGCDRRIRWAPSRFAVAVEPELLWGWPAL